MMKKLLLILVLIGILLVSGCFNKTGIPEKTGIPKCDWQPEKDYGPCEMMCRPGVYYDNSLRECMIQSTSGCSCPHYPFKLNLTRINILIDECKEEGRNLMRNWTNGTEIKNYLISCNKNGEEKEKQLTLSECRAKCENI